MLKILINYKDGKSECILADEYSLYSLNGKLLDFIEILENKTGAHIYISNSDILRMEITEIPNTKPEKKGAVSTEITCEDCKWHNYTSKGGHTCNNGHLYFLDPCEKFMKGDKNHQ